MACPSHSAGGSPEPRSSARQDLHRPHPDGRAAAGQPWPLHTGNDGFQKQVRFKVNQRRAAFYEGKRVETTNKDNSGRAAGARLDGLCNDFNFV